MTVKRWWDGLHSHSQAMASCEESAESSAPSGPNSSSQNAGLGRGQLSAQDKEKLRHQMLVRLSATAAHFVHQQRDVPDLSQQEKFDVAAKILLDNPVTFLSRFGKYLTAADLPYFQDVDKDNYEMQFYLKEIGYRCSHWQVIVKNRRFAAMQELDAAGVYFSEDQMKSREPLLYEQMIGQFMTQEEEQERKDRGIDRSDLRFSTILLAHIDDNQRKDLFNRQKETEECQEEEEEESEEEEEEGGENTEMAEEEEEEEVPEISSIRATDIWRQQQRDEFTAILHEKFLSGDDDQFDYSKVDDNPDYDSITAMEQDEEQRYFLSEDPQVAEQDDGSGAPQERLCQHPQMEKGADEEEEEVEDYMLYQPDSDLVAKSAHFVKIGSWTVDDADS